KSDAGQYEYKCKSTKVKKSGITPTKKNGGGLRKDQGQSRLEKLNQGHLHKHSAIHKNEQNSPIRSAIEPTVDKIAGPSKSNFKINGAVTFKSER
ncbi:hypothetical protein KI387_014161, partial [Taxus chinensis]